MSRKGRQLGGSGSVTAMSQRPAIDTPVIIVLFGATGDLAKRMVLPAFYTLAEQQLMPEDYLLIGTGRGEVTDEQFRQHIILNNLSIGCDIVFINTVTVQLP